jgi:hypothetical protein
MRNRFFSISRMLVAILTVLCVTRSQSARAAEPSDPLTISVDPKVVGIWQTVAKTYAGEVTYNLEISADGGYKLQPNSGLDGETGVFESGSGQWRMTSTANRHDAGKYEFLADDRIRLTGGSGAVEWTRASHDVKPNPPAQSRSADGLPVLSLHGIPVPPDPTFDALRASADAVAAEWDPKAALCRADLIGSYSRSIPKFKSIRLLYFRPDDSNSGPGNKGFEVVYDSATDQTRQYGAAYPFTHAKGLCAAPRSVIDPKEALRKLWELEPSVPPDQVCLQLIKPGVEEPLLVDGEQQLGGQRSSYPRAEFMEKFVAAMGDNESQAPKDRFVWRMLAIRDFDAPLGEPYGTFVYLDAADGSALSPRGPAVLGADLAFLKVPQGSPVPIFDFGALPPGKQIPIDGPAYEPATFDLLATRQKAESLDLGLRRLIAGQRSDSAIASAIDRIAGWSKQVDSLHSKADAEGLALLQNQARQDPRNIALHAVLAHRYVDEVAKERTAMFHALPPSLRFDVSTFMMRNGPAVALDHGTWVYGLPDSVFISYPRLAKLPSMPSKFFAAASRELDNVLAMDPSQPTAFTDRVRLESMEAVGMDDQYAACEKALRADPNSPMANLLFALYPSQWNDEKLDEATQLRSARTWYSSDVRFGVNVIVTTTYKNFSYPTGAEIAGAEQAAGEAQQMAIWATTLRDRAMKIGRLDPMPYFMTGRALVDRLDMRDRVACDGLLADPGDPQLHALRGRTYEMAANGQAVLSAVSDAAITLDNPYTAAGCLALARRVASKDAFTGYCAALQAVRMAPTDPEANLILAASLEQLSDYTVNGVELMPDALEQAQLQYAVAAKVAAWAATQPGANPQDLQKMVDFAQSAHERNYRVIN